MCLCTLQQVGCCYGGVVDAGFRPCPTHNNVSWMLDLRVPLHVAAGQLLLRLGLWMQVSGPAPTIAICHGCWRSVGPSVRIRRFDGPPVRTTAWHLCAAVWCSSPDPPPDPAHTHRCRCGARGGNGLVNRSFHIKHAFVRVPFVVGVQPCWSWARRELDRSMPGAALVPWRRHHITSDCSHGST